MVAVGSPYDSSASVLAFIEKQGPNTSLDQLITTYLGPFANWDGVYFTHIAHHGYDIEQFHAFFPLLPHLINVVRYVLGEVALIDCLNRTVAFTGAPY
jgi:hypothetical protein